MSDVPKRYATHRGTIPITIPGGDVELQCFVLDDETRVISGRTMTKAIGMKGRGQGIRRISTHPSLIEHLTDDLDSALAHPIVYRQSKGGTGQTVGYEATVLLSVCDVVLGARDAGALVTEQELRYGQYCEALVRAFARVGIIALVDEATGFQAERERDALAKLLSAYIAEELLPWARRFPDEYYEQLFRLRGWPYNSLNTKRPRLVGKLTNEIVYKKLPPGVLDELRSKNPVVSDTGQRRHKHHQFLTEDIGHEHLKGHLLQVIALMKISPNWPQFKRHLERAFPTPGKGVQDSLFEE